MIKVHVFHTGAVKVDQAIPLHDNNPLAVTGLFRGEDKKLILPVSCYLIEHPKGNILIDTGWNTKYADIRPMEKMGIVDKISGPIIEKDEGVDSKLKSCGLKDTDIKAVYLSHMDFDHTSGLCLVRHAGGFYASREEIKDAERYKLRYVDTWTSAVMIEPFDYQASGIGPVGKSFDVFADGSIQLISTPGHTHGHFSVKISSGGKYMVLADDAAYLQASFEARRIPGFTVDRRLAEKSLAWLIACRQDPDCMEVLANHDPSVAEHIDTL